MPRRTQKIERDEERKSHVMAVVWGVVILAGFIAVLGLSYRIQRNIFPAEYEGVIVEKWADYQETDQGSRPHFWLLLEMENGQRLTIGTTSHLYNQARVGSRIRKTSAGIELMDPATDKTG
jgi:hypothetical protein